MERHAPVVLEPNNSDIPLPLQHRAAAAGGLIDRMHPPRRLVGIVECRLFDPFSDRVRVKDAYVLSTQPSAAPSARSREAIQPHAGHKELHTTKLGPPADVYHFCEHNLFGVPRVRIRACAQELLSGEQQREVTTRSTHIKRRSELAYAGVDVAMLQRHTKKNPLPSSPKKNQIAAPNEYSQMPPLWPLTADDGDSAFLSSLRGALFSIIIGVHIAALHMKTDGKPFNRRGVGIAIALASSCGWHLYSAWILSREFAPQSANWLYASANQCMFTAALLLPPANCQTICTRACAIVTVVVVLNAAVGMLVIMLSMPSSDSDVHTLSSVYALCNLLASLVMVCGGMCVARIPM